MFSTPPGRQSRSPVPAVGRVAEPSASQRASRRSTRPENMKPKPRTHQRSRVGHTDDRRGQPPTPGGAAPGGDAPPTTDVQELVNHLYDPLAARLRAELWLDRGTRLVFLMNLHR